jgi:L-seryl-tRNA(Ser) seleniumtransferase
VLADGIDLVTFSGDKLLGSTQAGIIVGKRDLLAQIKRNPLKRALRADKITLAILEATLRFYEDPETVAEHIPLLRTLTASEESLQARAQEVSAAFAPPWETEIESSSAQIGSGALPDKTIASLSVTVRHPEKSPDQIATDLRGLPTPVIARISDERV